MKVRDLIEDLQRMDPDDGVTVRVGYKPDFELVPIVAVRRAGPDGRDRCALEPERTVIGPGDISSIKHSLSMIVESL